MPKKKANLIANLPTELVDDKLLRFPVKSLVRFRCVSKRWLAFINSPDFIKLHLNRSTETTNNRSIIVRPSYSAGTYSVDMDSPDVAVEIDHPLKSSRKYWPEVMGSCRGLVLLRYEAVSGSCDDIIIWNPSTRNYHELPFSCFNSIGNYEEVVYGLGYDSVHDDYKVVKIIQFYDNGEYLESEVQVYSLKSNTWRRIRDFPYYICSTSYGHGVFSCGSLNWAVYESRYKRDSDYIGAFDLATEEYRLVPMPNTVYKKFFDYRVNLAGLEGCLCIFYNNWKEEYTDVWVMKSYGVIESWTKLISVSSQTDGNHVFIFPLFFSKDGREVVLMQKGDNLIWFDLESKVEKVVHVRGLPNKFRAEFVTQSLVPLGRGSRTYA